MNKKLIAEQKAIRMFDGSSATIKRIKPDNQNMKELEERQVYPEFLKDTKERTAVFDSEKARFEANKSRSPGPGVYNPN